MTTFDSQLDRFDILVKNFFESKSTFFPALDSKLIHPVDIYEHENEIVFEIACTGLSKSDIRLSVDSDILRIVYKKNTDDTNKKYFCRQIAKRSFDLGYKISSKYDISKLSAQMENGLLIVKIPFTETSIPKEIIIK